MSQLEDSSILNRFLKICLEDQERGGLRSLDEYAEMFPGHRAIIEDELRRLQRERGEQAGADGTGERFGNYRLLRKLGGGGQGVVYLAEDCRLSRRVALKLLTRSPFASEQALLRFQREAQVTSRLDDPGICTVHETGVEDGMPFIAMRLVEGENLATKIAAARAAKDDGDTRLEIPSSSSETASGSHRQQLLRVVQLIESVARSLHIAHEAGVVHRDIKPANIMVTPEGSPVLLDFGLAQIHDENTPTLTRTGEVFGTPAYMPPEQFDAEPGGVDRSADVYSLGVVLYECSTLRRPFEAVTRDALYLAIRNDDPQDPRILVPDLPFDLKVILETALAKEPGRRYHTALDLAEDLRRLRCGEPILARPASRSYRIRKFILRNRILVGATAIVILSLSVATALTARGLVKALQAEQAEAESTRRTRRALQVFEDIFSSSDPDRDGPGVTLLEVLDRSSGEVIDGLADEPLIAARLMTSLGRVYAALGSYAKAEPLLSDAVTTLADALGSRDQDTLAAMHSLAGLRTGQARHVEAEELFRTTLQGRQETLGMKDPATLQTHRALGVLYLEMGRYQESEFHLRKAQEGFDGILGPQDGEVARTLNELARLLYELGKFEQAEQLWLESVRSCEEILGAEHSATLQAYRSLATHYQQVGRMAEAEELLRKAYEGFCKKQGEHGPDALGTLNDLAFLYKSEGQYDQAEERYLLALEGQRQLFAEDHPSVLATVNNLGQLYLAQGRHADAERELRRAFEGWQRTRGERYKETLVSMNNLGLLYETMQRLDDAEPLLSRAYELRSEVFGPTHRESLASLNNLAWFYRSKGDMELAEEMFLESYQLRLDGFGANDPYTLRAQLNLGDLYRILGKTGPAEDHLRRALSGFRELVGATNPDTLTTLNQLVILLRDTDRREEALPMARELYELTPESDPRRARRQTLIESLAGSK